jgi:thermostable 8-oxoguanine DNA glycosylase
MLESLAEESKTLKIGSKETSHFYRNADFKPLLTISKHNDKPIYKNDGFITLALKH